MLFKSLAFALALAAAVNAQIAFTQPVAGTVWTAGQPAVIQWNAANGGTLNNNPLTIELLNNVSGSAVTLGNIAVVKASAGTVTITVYDKLISDNHYSLRANGTFYSDQFQIQSSVTSGNPATVRIPATSVTSDASKSSWSVLALGLAAGGAVMMA